MANNYYEFTTPFVPGTKVRSEQVNNELNGVESAFEFLPGNNAALQTGISTLGIDSQGASVNEYLIASPDPQASLVNGQHIAFQATHTNADAVTINTDSTGLVAAVRADGSAIVAGDIVLDLFYEFRYDTTNTRWHMTSAPSSFVIDAAASAAAALVSETNAATSETNAGTSETNAAASETAADGSATSAEDWAIRVEDDPVPVSSGGDGATTYSALHWAAKSSSFAGGATGTFTDTNAIDLVDASVALRVGAVDPTASQHLELDPQAIQSKSNGTTAAALTINTLGGNVDIGPTSGTGSVNLYNSGDLTLSTTASGVEIPASTGESKFMATAAAGAQAKLYLIADTGGVALISDDTSGNARISQLNAAGTTIEESWIDFARNGSVDLLYNGALKSRTINEGVSYPGDAITNVRILSGSGQGIQAASVGGSVKVLSLNRGGNAVQIGNALAGVITLDPVSDFINIQDTSGEYRVNTNVLLSWDNTNSAAALHHNGAAGEVARTLVNTAGGFEVDNTLTGTGFERVLTESDGVVYAKQNGNQTISGTTPTAISALQVDLDIGTYRMECLYAVLAGATGLGLDITFVDLNTATADTSEDIMLFQASRLSSADLVHSGSAAAIGVEYAIPISATSVITVHAVAHIVVTVAGTIDVLMSQTTGGTAHSLRDGSHVTYTRIN